ncbi:hypothetical protein EON64_19325 [archaeon]|nr:MAG: hypothetical protein EON64_19325 [archaeon]
MVMTKRKHESGVSQDGKVNPSKQGPLSKKGKMDSIPLVAKVANKPRTLTNQHQKKTTAPIAKSSSSSASADPSHSSSVFRDSVITALDAMLAILNDHSDKTREHYRETFMSKALVLDNSKSQFEASRREKKRMK